MMASRLSTALRVQRGLVRAAFLEQRAGYVACRTFSSTQTHRLPRQIPNRTSSVRVENIKTPVSLSSSDNRQDAFKHSAENDADLNDDLPWYLREQERSQQGDGQAQEQARLRKRQQRQTEQLANLKPDVKLPHALKGLHDLLTSGAPSPLVQRPDEGEYDSETGRRPIAYIHARQHDEQSWTDWIVVVQVRSSSGSAVSRVAKEIGAYLENAQPPSVSQARLQAEQKREKRLQLEQRPWKPFKILSREAQDGLRLLHANDPERWSRKALAEAFKMSVESVRRILKSTWKPSSDVVARQNRRARERQEERRQQFQSQGWQGREQEEIERIRKSMAQSNTSSGTDQSNHLGDLEDYHVVDEDGNLAQDEKPFKQIVRYEGLVQTSSSTAAQSSIAPKSRGAKTGTMRGDGEWCLVDADWCVVHVMTAKARVTYDVERPYLTPQLRLPSSNDK